MNYSIHEAWYRTPLFWELFLLDRLSKISVTSFLSNGPVIFNKYFSFEFVLNRGISWGMLSPQTQWGAFGITGVTVIVLGFLAKYTFDRQMLGHNVVGETLILAGGFGNCADRLIYNGVVDFIKISFAGKTFPLFNIADIAITLGACVILYHSFYSNEA